MNMLSSKINYSLVGEIFVTGKFGVLEMYVRDLLGRMYEGLHLRVSYIMRSQVRKDIPRQIFSLFYFWGEDWGHTCQCSEHSPFSVLRVHSCR